MTEPLAPPPPTPAVPAADPDGPALRLRRAVRDRVVPVPAYLEELLPDDHLARLLWEAVGQLDLSAFTADLKVVEGGPGRAAADPRVLITLWLYATSQGVTSARALDRLCVEHLVYLWICGGVSVNYHTLSDVRTQHAAALDDLMTQVLGRLRHAGLIAFEQVAQDGLRVRASAGAASFRRQPTLERALAEAAALVAQGPAGGGPTARGPTARQQAAREGAARERAARVHAALAAMPAAQAAKKPAERAQARVSTTDPEARVMKMGDGGFRPAYNVQLAADTAEQVIVGVEVTTSGSDMDQAVPMLEQVQERLASVPKQWSFDGGFPSHETLDRLTAAGIEVLAPVPTPKDPERDPHQPRLRDSAAVAAWRVRMGQTEAKVRYRMRAATIECVNAKARMQHGLTQLRVRGLAKVRCIAVWVAITHNLKLLVTPQKPAPAATAGAASAAA